jgi:hypothetical protein
MLKRNLQAFEKHCTDLVLEERANLAVHPRSLSMGSLLKASRKADTQRKQKQGDAAAERGILSVMLGEGEDGSSMPLSRIVDNIKTFLYDAHTTHTTNAHKHTTL